VGHACGGVLTVLATVIAAHESASTVAPAIVVVVPTVASPRVVVVVVVLASAVVGVVRGASSMVGVSPIDTSGRRAVRCSDTEVVSNGRNLTITEMATGPEGVQDASERLSWGAPADVFVSESVLASRGKSNRLDRGILTWRGEKLGVSTCSVLSNAGRAVLTKLI
jgi:hypothetical protein